MNAPSDVCESVLRFIAVNNLLVCRLGRRADARIGSASEAGCGWVYIPTSPEEERRMASLANKIRAEILRRDVQAATCLFGESNSHPSLGPVLRVQVAWGQIFAQA